MDYEAEDKGALMAALLALRTCPKCRRDLRPVAFSEDTWGCPGDWQHGAETWYLPAREEC